MRVARWLLVLATVTLVAVVLAPRATTWVIARGDVVDEPARIPKLGDDEHRVAIVLGAGLVDKRPSPLLADRIDAAMRLLDEGRVDRLLMSGDNTTQWYDEPSAMRRAAIAQGAGVEQVAVDYAGRRTWDTCVRAHRLFGVDEAVVVTNAFHADRALTTCRAAGIDTTGLSVDDSRYRLESRVRWRARELAASGRALLDAWVLRPPPAVGGTRIDPYDPCELYDSLAPSVARQEATTFASFGCTRSM